MTECRIAMSRFFDKSRRLDKKDNKNYQKYWSIEYTTWKGLNNINCTNFPAPDAHFDNTCLFSDARGQNILKSKAYIKDEELFYLKPSSLCLSRPCKTNTINSTATFRMTNNLNKSYRMQLKY